MKETNQSLNNFRQGITFLEHNRFLQIYFLSLKLPSWEVIGINLMGEPITEQEYHFVMKKTRKGGKTATKY
jgi:hypothetical protein